MLTVRTSENTVITSFRLISERQDFSSVRTGENTVRARARIHLTNSQELSATEVADLYKERWQIELFFKRIKQNLVIKTFVGTTENAVMTQLP